MYDYTERPTETDEQEMWQAATFIFRAEATEKPVTSEQMAWALHIESISDPGYFAGIIENMYEDLKYQ